MTDWLADRDALREQYADASNLEDRQALHAEYSTADTPLREWQFAQFSLPESAVVLSVGCGPGDLWPDVSERVPVGWTITLSDFSAGMLETAEENLGVDIADQVRFAAADVAALPFGDDSFDAATANHMLYHVPDRDAALADLARVLRPGSRLYATTNGENSMRVIYDVLEDVLGYRPARGSEFTLQNGRAQLTPHFDEVECRRFEDALLVDDVEPLVRYVLSRDDVPETTAPDLHRAFAERFEDGTLRVEKELGMFVARTETA